MAPIRPIVAILCIVVVCTPLFVMANVKMDGDGGINDLGEHTVGSRTDDRTVEREEQAMVKEGFSIAEKKLMREVAEKHEFQAEVASVMSIVVNSLYSNKEIFLRELISNASDALDKIRFLSLTDTSLLGDKPELEIRIKYDHDAKLLSVTDTGVGMSHEELIKNLGTLAKSGSKEFVAKIMKDKGDGNVDANLIGQFGVGFYSVYLVADAITVVSKHNEDDQYIWFSEAEKGFSIMKDPAGNTLGRGTTVTLEMQDDALEYLDAERIKLLVKKYSEFIDYPIYLYECKTVKEKVPVEEKEQTKSEDADVQVEDEQEKETEKEIEKLVCEWKHVNEHKPIWTRKADDITEEEYFKFYTALTRDDKKPLGYAHFTAEGDVTFRSILYVPEELPPQTFEKYGAPSTSIKLYVRRVFITDKFEELMPNYLSFVKGLIDSDDLPLNVSREDLSHHRMLKIIRRKLIKKCLDLFKSILDDPAKTEMFYRAYSTNLKLGIVEDSANRGRISKMLKFKTTVTEGEKLATFDDYVEKMKEGQKGIFYLAGPVLTDLERSPFLERLKRKGYEVLLCTDPLDEYVFSTLREYEGHQLIDITKEGLDLGDDIKELETEYEELINWIKPALGDKIQKAVVSVRLTTSPAAVSTTQYSYSANMERIVKAQAMRDPNAKKEAEMMSSKKTLELNPYHPIVVALNKRVKDNKEDVTAKELAELLYDTASLQSGFALDDNVDFTKRIHSFLKLSLGLDTKAEVDVNSLPEEKEPVPEPEAEQQEDAQDVVIDDKHDEL